jgi:Excalibur calcium-binding domain
MFRRTTVSLLAAAFAVVPTASLLSMAIATPVASARDKNCSDFKNQKKAQHWFRKHHPRRDPSNLDADHDGIACEDNPCPCDHRKPHGFVVGRIESRL